MLPRQLESLSGGCAEVLALQSYLNIGAVLDVVDESLAAVQAAGAEAGDASDNAVLTVGFCKSLEEPAEEDADACDYSDESGAHGQRAEVLSDGPAEAGAQVGVAAAVRGGREVLVADADVQCVVENVHEDARQPEACEGLAR